MFRKRVIRYALLCIPLALVTLGTAFEPPALASTESEASRVVVAFLPAKQPRSKDQLPIGVPLRERATVLARLAARPTLSIGFVGSTQGTYAPLQALLDITQGTRASLSTYSPDDPPPIVPLKLSLGAYLLGWSAVVRRADSAPAEIEPGLLASSIPGGGAYIGLAGREHNEAVVAANRYGWVEEFSLGSAATLPVRVRGALGRHRLAVVGLSPGPLGGKALNQLLATRKPDELVIVVQSPPKAGSPQLLAAGMDGGGKPGTLTSESTRRKGIVAGIDLLPTVLKHLSLPISDKVKGRPVETVPGRRVDTLEHLKGRLKVVGKRRLATFQALIMFWLLAIFGLGALRGPSGVRKGLRLGGLAALWVPSLLLLTAVLAPSRTIEAVTVGGGALLLAALNDRLFKWPTGPLLPALVATVAYTVDLAAGSELVIRSLLGPNPLFGSRYFGFGNELEAVFAVLVPVGVSAGFGTRLQPRRMAQAFALSGVALCVIVGWGRLGADVGGVLTVAAGSAAATVAVFPTKPSRKTWVVLALVLPVALAALILLDVLTGGNSHLTRTVLQANDLGDIWDVIARRYSLAFKQLTRGAMPFLTLICVFAVGYAIRNRAALYRSTAQIPAWRAALVGGLAASVVGTLFNDSGPMLLLFGVVLLAFVTIYLSSKPRELE